MKSNWEQTKKRSRYHFDPQRRDQAHEVLTHLGTFAPIWLDDIEEIVANAEPATWASRGYKGEGLASPPADLAAEEYDLERAGMSKDAVITHLNWHLPPSLQITADSFGLDHAMYRIHVQQPGEVWNLHIDKLQKWNPEDWHNVMRIFIQLTDWQPGQFWEYGNYHWNQWRAGDVTTFDWLNTPHSTANAGYHPRVTFQLTGNITDKTRDFLEILKYPNYRTQRISDILDADL
jgi:hypothetical protein